MKGIVITPAMEIRVQEFSAPLYESLGAAVGGYIEHVLPRGLERPYCLICNEEGRLKGLPVNPIASWLYGMQEHGQPIVGTIVLMKDEARDIVGLSSEDMDKLVVMLSKLKCRLAGEFCK